MVGGKTSFIFYLELPKSNSGRGLYTFDTGNSSAP